MLNFYKPVYENQKDILTGNIRDVQQSPLCIYDICFGATVKASAGRKENLTHIYLVIKKESINQL